MTPIMQKGLDLYIRKMEYGSMQGSAFPKA